MMRRTDALRTYCADPTNIDDTTLKGAKLVMHHLARIRERDRGITRHAPDYPGQQDEASEVATCISKAIQRSGAPPLTHAPRMALVKRPRHSKHDSIVPFQATEAAWHFT